METVSLVHFLLFFNLITLLVSFPLLLEKKKMGKFFPFPISKLKWCISIGIFTVKCKDGTIFPGKKVLSLNSVNALILNFPNL